MNKNTLFEAIKDNNLKRVKECIAHGIDINSNEPIKDLLEAAIANGISLMGSDLGTVDFGRVSSES